MPPEAKTKTPTRCVHGHGKKAEVECIKLEAHSAEVDVLELSSNGMLLASAALGDKVKLWNVTNGELYGELYSPIYRIAKMAFSPSGKRLALSSREEIVLWDVLTASRLWTSPLADASHNALTFSPNDGWLALALDNWVTIWDTRTTMEEEHACFEYGTDFVSAAAFSPNSKRLAVAWGNEIVVWDVPGKKRLSVLKGHSSVVSSVVFSPNGKLVSSISRDKTVKLWCAEAGKLYETLEVSLEGAKYHPFPKAVAFSPDSRHLAVVAGHIFKLWDVESGETTERVVGNDSKLRSLLFPRKGEYVVTNRGRIDLSAPSSHVALLDIPFAHVYAVHERAIASAGFVWRHKGIQVPFLGARSDTMVLFGSKKIRAVGFSPGYRAASVRHTVGCSSSKLETRMESRGRHGTTAPDQDRPQPDYIPMKSKVGPRVVRPKAIRFREPPFLRIWRRL